MENYSNPSPFISMGLAWNKALNRSENDLRLYEEGIDLDLLEDSAVQNCIVCTVNLEG